MSLGRATRPLGSGCHPAAGAACRQGPGRAPGACCPSPSSQRAGGWRTGSAERRAGGGRGPTEPPRRAFPLPHHQRVHRGQAPDVGLGGSVGPGHESRLQPAHQCVEHRPGKGHVLGHSQPHLCQVASQRQGTRTVGLGSRALAGQSPPRPSGGPWSRGWTLEAGSQGGGRGTKAAQPEAESRPAPLPMVLLGSHGLLSLCLFLSLSLSLSLSRKAQLCVMTSWTRRVIASQCLLCQAGTRQLADTYHFLLPTRLCGRSLRLHFHRRGNAARGGQGSCQATAWSSLPDPKSCSPAQKGRDSDLTSPPTHRYRHVGPGGR